MGEAIGPVDQIRAMAPWSGPTPSQPWDVLQADAVLQFTPWRHLVFDAWSKGQLPLWNPHQLMGTPLLANSQSAGFYPPHMLLGWLGMPLYPSMAILAWLHLFWAGLGVYRLSACIGASRAGATVASISFSLSAFMLSWSLLPSVTSTVAWIPWVLACVVRVFQSGVFWGIFSPPPHSVRNGSAKEALEELQTLPRMRVKAWIGLATSTSMMLLAGHLQFCAFGLLAAVLVVLLLGLFQCGVLGWRGRGLLWAPALGSTAACGLALGTGFLLAAPQVLPVLAFSRHAHRLGVASESGYDAYAAGAIQPFELSGLVFPTVLGHPLQSSEVLPGATSFWPAYVKPGGNFAESALGFGPMVLILLALVPRKAFLRRECLAIGSVGVLGAAIAFGTPLNRLMYFGLPGWSATASPGRAGVLMVLAGCVLASLGADSNVRTRTGWLGFAAAIMLGAVTCALPFYLHSSMPDPYGLGPNLGRLASEAVGRASLPMAAALAVAALAMFVPAGRYRPLALATGAIAVAFSSLNWVSPISTGRPLERPSAVPGGRIAAINARWQLLIRETALLPANSASLFGFEDLAGYDSLLDRETKSLLDGANGQDSAPAANGNLMFIKPSVSLERLKELGVSVAWSLAPLPGRPPDARNGLAYVYQVGGRRVDNGERNVSLVEDGYDRQVLDAEGPGTLVVRDRNMVGWSATVDGLPASLAPGPFRVLQLPPGPHRIVFRYLPPGLETGLWLCMTGLGAVAVALGLLRTRGPRRPDPVKSMAGFGSV